MTSPLDGAPHPFLQYLVSILPAYEQPHSPVASRLPEYDGPADQYTSAILSSIENIAKRILSAEAQIEQYTSTHDAGSQSVVIPSARQPQAETAAPVLANVAPSAPVPLREIAEETSPSIDGEKVDTNAVVPSTTHAPSVPAPPLVIPPGPLVQPGITTTSPIEEIRLLKTQLSDIARVCTAVSRGDLSQTITGPVQGVVMTQLRDIMNTMVGRLSAFATEIARVCLELGTEGILGSQAYLPNAEGTWKELTDIVNTLLRNTTSQMRSTASVVRAIALGDFTRTFEVDARGEVLDLKRAVNAMVQRVRALHAEVGRVTAEVVEHGTLERGAEVADAEGSWKDLLDNVNRISAVAVQR